MDDLQELQERYLSIKHEATRLAGDLGDLAQRATVYHHVYDHSNGNHSFPLIAAHGALWARDYFAYGMKIGRVLSLQYLAPARRHAQLKALTDFANAFRDINRRVCIEIYTNYYFTLEYGKSPHAAQFVSPKLLHALNILHAAVDDHRRLSDQRRRLIFQAHFLDEQELIVGPSIDQALTEFAWPAMKWLALRPCVRFAYFPEGKQLKFRNFSRLEERVERGLGAFDTAASVGWKHVEAALAAYEILPRAFFERDSKAHFAEVRELALA